MLSARRLTIFAGVAFSLALASRPLDAKKAEKPDKDVTEAIEAEHAGDFEKALDLINKALAKKPGELTYQIAAYRIHFECGAARLHQAMKLRNSGDLNGALQLMEKAGEADPSSDQIREEIKRTKKMIERYEKGGADLAVPPEVEREENKTLTPAELERKKQAEKVASILDVPELKALDPSPINLKMVNQKPRVLFDTVGKEAGINVIFDPDYDTTNTIKQASIELSNASLAEALDDVALVTKSFWKVITPNTIFVTQDSRQKRQEYEEQVVKVFYMQNMGSAPQELNEAVTVLRTVADIQKIFTSTPMNAIIIRASADKIPLAEKLIAAIDKPKSEVIVDCMVMEVNRTYMRNLSAAIGVGGINTSINFTPRTQLQGVQNTSTTGTTATTGTTTATTTGTTGSTTSTTSNILLSNISHISTADYTVSGVPGGLIEALLSDASTKVLETPQIRALDNYKASLKIGEKIPTATGSFQPGVGGVGVNPLVNTQFTYLDVGVNVDMTPRVNSATDVSAHIAVEVSQEDSTVSIGGISQPVIGQKRVEMDLRMKDGEINIIGGLIDNETDNTISGVPGLASIPLVGNLFKSTQLNKIQNELLIVLVPHIIRSPDITEDDLRAVATGNETTYRLNYAPAKVVAPAAKDPVAALVPGTPPATAPLSAPPGATPPAPVTPANPAAVSFIATPPDVPAGSTVTANVQVNNVTDLSAVQMVLKFDPKILRINNIIGGELMRKNGPELIPSRNVLNDSGTATIGIVRNPSSGGTSGSGTVLTVVFQAVGKGATSVSVPQLTLTGVGGQPIPASPPTLAVNVR